MASYLDFMQSVMGRASLRWTRSDLAEAAGVDPRSIGRFETGKTVAPETVLAIRKALERAGVVFIGSGPHSGGVVPPSR